MPRRRLYYWYSSVALERARRHSSSAQYALLGLLQDRPDYAYQLRIRLEQRLGPSWRINSGQFSRLVKTLEREGLIERVEGRKADRRRWLAIKRDGEDDFERWFDEPPQIRLPRRPLLVKLTFAGPHRLRDALGKIDAYEKACAQTLQELAKTRRDVPTGGPLVRADHVLLRLNLGADISYVEGELEWAKHARETISWLMTSDALWPSRAGRSDQRSRESEGARRTLFSRIASTETRARQSGPASDD